jgi:hypothetical protein
MTPLINLQNYISVHFLIKFRVQIYSGLVILRLIISAAAPPVFRMPSWRGAELGAKEKLFLL